MSKFLLAFLILGVSEIMCFNRSIDVTKIFGATNHTVFAGYMNTSINTTAQMFYHMFSPQGMTFDNSMPLIVWFQGGPGCSGWLGSLLELGPFQIIKVNKTLTTQYNPYNWAIGHNLLFIDQPLLVGYSTQGNSSAPHTTETSADQVEIFFDQFFQTYPNLKKNPLYIAGESYGGHYVPSFTARLLKKGYTIAGVMIGDGWTDPLKQIRLSTYQLSAGLISKNRFETYDNMENQAINLMVQGKYADSGFFFDQETGEVPNSQDIGNITGADLLNYRKYSGEIDSDYTGQWLDDPKVREAFQVPKELGSFVACSIPIYESFGGDVMQSWASNFTTLLQSTKLLLYSGQNDIEVNTASAYKWISEIDWQGSDTFATSKKIQWIPKNDGNIKGFVRKSGSLTFVQVNDAGHLLPQDQPEMAFIMIQNWMNGNL